MSDAGSPDLPEYAPKPHGDGLWGRYLGAATWVKVAIPLVVIALVLGVGVLIGQSGNDSTSSEDQNTEELLALLAAKMAAQDETTTTVAETTTTEAETTTTEEETTTTEAETTTTEAETTTTVAETTTTPTTVPVTPTTPAPPPPTTPPPTEPPTTEAPPTEPTTEAPPTEAPTTEAPPTEAPTTEAPPTEAPTTEPVIPPGALFASLEDFQTAWNATAQGSSVGPISSWSPVDVDGTAADVANIGGNLRVGAVLNGANGAVTRVAIGWLPLSDESQQAQQNALFQDAFSVLVQTVNPAATSGQQSSLASKLGITTTEPPFPTGTTNRATLLPERYVLEAVDVPGQPGPVTIVGARRL